MPAERAPTRTPNRTARTSAEAPGAEAPGTEVRSTEAFSPRYRGIDCWDAPDVLQTLLEGQLAAVAAVGPALPAIGAAATAAVARLRAGGRLCYAGAGTSGRLAVLDGVELTVEIIFGNKVVQREPWVHFEGPRFVSQHECGPPFLDDQELSATTKSNARVTFQPAE